MVAESINFDMAPVYGQLGVELSGLAAEQANLDGVDEGQGNDSERILSITIGSLVVGVSLNRCRDLLLGHDRMSLWKMIVSREFGRVRQMNRGGM